ncbi:DSBA oxidoreductase [Xylariomycetidae sp. FL2044]|nr:DSBA oxidoreductase [Xylariomycetidae sp. FL2044]
MTNFNIKIVSDPVCPWCYIGKKRLDQSIELYRRVYPGGKDDTFTVGWYPFYLDPSSPAVGVPLRERMAQRFGPERVQGLTARLAQMGREVGIDFNFDSRTGRTRDAHRLIQLGKTKGPEVENAVVMALFRAYFEEAGDITSHADLAGAAVRAGIDRREVQDWLASDRGGDVVDAEVQKAYAQGIHGVPNFMIQDKYQVDGAQDPQAFLALLAKIKEEEGGK